jgi:hypothetical protein
VNKGYDLGTFLQVGVLGGSGGDGSGKIATEEGSFGTERESAVDPVFIRAYSVKITLTTPYASSLWGSAHQRTFRQLGNDQNHREKKKEHRRLKIR